MAKSLIQMVRERYPVQNQPRRRVLEENSAIKIVSFQPNMEELVDFARSHAEEVDQEDRRNGLRR